MVIAECPVSKKSGWVEGQFIGLFFTQSQSITFFLWEGKVCKDTVHSSSDIATSVTRKNIRSYNQIYPKVYWSRSGNN
jgi:hypothetical protein